MTRLAPQMLQRIGCEIFQAAGCSEADAQLVAEHLVESSLFGHDSHGAIRFYEYVEQRMFNPRGAPRIVQERACMAVVDGGGALGQIGATFATQLAIRKAREHGTATVTLRNTSHVGRVGAYPLMVAREGLIGLMFVNGGRLGFQIAPYGGLDGKLTTNPIAFAAPRRGCEPILVDMATSMVAEGKVRVASNQGKPLPPGCIIDHHGTPSTDPQDYLGEPRGAILPIGGAAAHKGYCLGFLVELLAGALSGQGCAAGERRLKSNGATLTVYDIGFFTDLDSYYTEVENLIQHVLSSRIDPSVGQILLPGQPEWNAAEHRRKHGIELDDTTWSRICGAAEGLGIDVSQWQVHANPGA